MTRDTSSKQKNARESGQEYRGKEHQLEQRPQRQGRRRPAADRQTLASGACVRREKGDQQHRQARRGDGAIAGIKSLIAPSISNTPVALTIRSGRGKTPGTIATRSALRFPQ